MSWLWVGGGGVYGMGGMGIQIRIWGMSPHGNSRVLFSCGAESVF